MADNKTVKEEVTEEVKENPGHVAYHVFTLLAGLALLGTGIAGAIYIALRGGYKFTNTKDSTGMVDIVVTATAAPTIVAGPAGSNTYVVTPAAGGASPITGLQFGNSQVNPSAEGGKISYSNGAGATFLALTILAFIGAIALFIAPVIFYVMKRSMKKKTTTNEPAA